MDIPVAAARPAPVTTPATGPAAGDPPADPPADPNERRIVERMSAAKTVEIIKHLADAPRVAGSDEFRAKAQWVVDQARAAGWDARIEELPDRGWMGTRTRYNVVAERRGTLPDDQRKVLIAGAHLDSVPRAPGGNDNASGSATLLAATQALQGAETAHDMRFLWFDGEEQGLRGSRVYVDAHREELLQRSIAMLNADMVGSPNGKLGMSLGYRTGEPLADAVRGAALRNGIDIPLLDERHGRSDHYSFDRAGIPALDFGVSVRSVGREDPNYHSPRDTASNINPDVLEGFGDVLALAAYRLAQDGRPGGQLIAPGGPGPDTNEPPL